MEINNKKINTFAIHTLGCKVNIFESNQIKNNLLANGLIEVPFNGFSDIYIINTCTVTNKADSKSRLFIKNAYKNNNEAIIIVAGCMSQLDKELINKLNISIQIGNKFKNDIYDLIQEHINNNNKKIIKIENLLDKNIQYEKDEKFVFLDKTRSFLKIQDGCNYMCSYCIIPFSRGKQRSKKLDEIINEIIHLVNSNYKEIVLTGVNTAGYFDGKNSFYDLLFQINKLEGDFRIRISSLEPFQITDEIINIICNNKNRFCQHWHICLQSGSNTILKDMNRKYSKNDFENIIKKIKKISINTSFTTDYIVGYPLENNKTFNESINFLKKIKFFDMHVFPFSKRKGTKAWLLENKIKRNVKEDMSKIIKIKEENKIFNLKKFINKNVEVIFEEKNNFQLYYEGYSSEYCRVYVKSESNIHNMKLNVKITELFLDGLYGEIIN